MGPPNDQVPVVEKYKRSYKVSNIHFEIIQLNKLTINIFTLLVTNRFNMYNCLQTVVTTQEYTGHSSHFKLRYIDANLYKKQL